MDTRLKKLRSLLIEQQVDAVLISSPANIVYFSGFSGFSSLERDGYLLITKTTAYILTSPLYAEAVKHIPHLSLITYTSLNPLQEQLAKLVRKHRLQRVGFEADNLTVYEWRQISAIFPKLGAINLKNIRIRKSRDEIAHIQKASLIADQALADLLQGITPGITEIELANKLENRIRTLVSDIAFPTIVAFGQNAAIPHHKSGRTKLKKNDLILIDFGAVHNEYRSDMTRTLFIEKPTAEQRQAYQAVLEAQREAAEFIKKQLNASSSEQKNNNEAMKQSNNTIKASDVDTIARDYLISSGYPSIPHSLGHGIGLAVHEAPSLSPRSQDILEEGMVFSLEPGIYYPGRFGIRIEDLYTIEDTKIKQLTTSAADLMEI